MIHPDFTRLSLDAYVTRPNAFRIFRHEVTKSLELHWHDFFEIGYILQGSGTHRLNGQPHQLRPGSLFLLTPADFHQFEIIEGQQSLQLYNMIFSSEFIPEEVYRMLFVNRTSGGWHFSDLSDLRLDNEFGLIWRESTAGDFGSQTLIQHTIAKILILVARCKQNESRSGSGTGEALPSAIQSALSYLHHHFRESLSLADVATHVQMSPNYFSECFHRQTGVSYQQYVARLRLAFSCNLLDASKLPITDVCYASGYNTLSQFEKAFKAKYGLSPTAYRKNRKHAQSSAESLHPVANADPDGLTTAHEQTVKPYD